jgi:hypothetical protein
MCVMLGWMDARGDLHDLTDGPVNRGSAVLRLWVDGVDRLGSLWTLGDLGTLRRQLDAAVERLGRGEDAIVRSAVEDQLTVPYLLFEPRGERILASCFLIRDPLVRHLFPESERLYDWVRAHREEVLSRGDEDTFRELSVPGDAFRAALIEQCALARTVGG